MVLLGRLIHCEVLVLEPRVADVSLAHAGRLREHPYRGACRERPLLDADVDVVAGSGRRVGGDLVDLEVLRLSAEGAAYPGQVGGREGEIE
jgi:hypothetical protein